MAITFRPTSTVTDEEIEALSRANPLHRFERTARGELVVMPGTGTDAGERDGKLFFQLALWNEQRKLGRAYPASTGFHLPNTALPSDDRAQIRNKMPEYIASGSRLAVCIDPRPRTVEIYRPDCETETFHNPAVLTFEPVLPGFRLDLSRVFGSA